MDSSTSETVPSAAPAAPAAQQSLSHNDPIMARNVSVVEGSGSAGILHGVEAMEADDAGMNTAGGNPSGSNEIGRGPTEIPAEDGDVAAPASSAGVKAASAKNGEDDTGNDGEEQDVHSNADDEANEEGDDQHEDDESDYSYEYEEEEDTHFAGFLIPTEFDNQGTAAASNDADNNAHVVAPLDNETSGAAAKNISRGTSNVSAAEGEASAASKTGKEPSTSSTSNAASSPRSNERKQKWKEPTQAAINMSLRAEKEKTGGRRRLASDLYKIMLADTSEAGFSLEPCDEDTMDKWKIKLFGFDEDSNLAKDLIVTGMDHVELEMSFPDQYPFEPPFVRVVRPRFKKQTGFVMSGALCMELLTKDGWNPINDIESVIVSIRSLMVVGDGRLQAAYELATEQYDLVLAARLEQKKAAAAGAKGEGESKAAGENEKDDTSTDSAKRKRADVDEDDPFDLKEIKKAAAKTRTFNAGSYTAQEASQAYDHLTKFHEQKGWDQSGWWAKKG